MTGCLFNPFQKAVMVLLFVDRTNHEQCWTIKYTEMYSVPVLFYQNVLVKKLQVPIWKKIVVELRNLCSLE